MTEVQDDASPVIPPPDSAPRNLAPMFLSIAAMAVLVTLLAASWVVWGRSGVSGTPRAADTATSVVKPSVNLPAGAAQCPAITGQTNGLNTSARGNDVTSCPFAEETRIAYARGGEASTEARNVVVYSPVTKQRYDMSCAVTGPDALVTCTGGNGAVVYLY